MSKLALSLASALAVSAAVSSTQLAHAQGVSNDPAVSGAAESLFQRPAPSKLGRLGWYVAPTSGFTSFDGRLGYTAGMRTALVIDKQFGFGVAGNVLGTTDTRFRDDEARDIGAYGGAYFQYTLRSTSLLHAFADVTMGAGAFCAVVYDDGCNENRFGFVEPTLNAELNLWRNVRFATGVGYRAAFAERGPGLSSRAISGAVVRSSLVFGMF